MDTSLAEFVIESGKRSSGPLKEAARMIGRELIPNPRFGRHGAKRFVYDEKVRATLLRLSEIPFKDFIAQFKHVLMPFDAFWIETSLPENEGQPGTCQRRGFFLKKKGDIISARFVQEHLLPKTLSSKVRMTPLELMQRGGIHVREDKYLEADNLEIVFSEKGIIIHDENSLAKWRAQKVGNSELKKQREAHTSCAEDIYRLLVLISSRNVETNLRRDPATPGPIEDPYPSITPIRIDLAAKLERALRDRSIKVVRELLGWTDVERHRQVYHTRNGPEVRIVPPYERRIAAPVDRRGVARHLTSTNSNLEIEFGPDYPRIKNGRRRKRLRSEPKEP